MPLFTPAASPINATIVEAFACARQAENVPYSSERKKSAAMRSSSKVSD